MTAENILKLIKEKEIDYVDLRFTDVRGKLQHMTQDISTIDADFLNDGTFFDGSSIAGWKAINESDMILKPDLTRAFVDPFTSHNTLVIFCDIMDPIKKTIMKEIQDRLLKKLKLI
jgi:Glutamine synthetase